MKTTLYYMLLLIFIALITGFLISSGNGQSMSMNQVLSVSAGLVLYTVGASLIGFGGNPDEREQHHRFVANKAGLVAGQIILCVGILIQLFTHHLDYWLLTGLIVINVAKLVSLIWLEYKK